MKTHENLNQGGENDLRETHNATEEKWHRPHEGQVLGAPEGPRVWEGTPEDSDEQHLVEWLRTYDLEVHGSTPEGLIQKHGVGKVKIRLQRCLCLVLEGKAALSAQELIDSLERGWLPGTCWREEWGNWNEWNPGAGALVDKLNQAAPTVVWQDQVVPN